MGRRSLTAEVEKSVRRCTESEPPLFFLSAGTALAELPPEVSGSPGRNGLARIEPKLRAGISVRKEIASDARFPWRTRVGAAFSRRRAEKARYRRSMKAGYLALLGEWVACAMCSPLSDVPATRSGRYERRYAGRWRTHLVLDRVSWLAREATIFRSVAGSKALLEIELRAARRGLSLSGGARLVRGKGPLLTRLPLLTSQRGFPARLQAITRRASASRLSPVQPGSANRLNALELSAA